MEETQKKKKESIFKRFEPFMGKKKVLMPIALISSRDKMMQDMKFPAESVPFM